MCNSVREAFIRLHDQNLIYRDNGIVNWCFHLNSTISDIEIDWIHVDKRTSFNFVNNNTMEIGILYFISLNIADSSETIQVATTRPCTIAGDVAIAVNNEDTRYKHLIGKNAINPLTNRLMPIIEDHRISKELGSGAVKITPSCSLVDFQIAKSHQLDIIEIFDSNGNLSVSNLNEQFQHLNGLNRFKLNEEVISILKATNQLKNELDFKTKIPICSKSGDLIEYRILPQWYLAVEKANEFIKEKLKANEIEFMPLNHSNTLLDWISYDKPWCISRQIAWGHQIPMYRFALSNCDAQERWIAANSLEEAKIKFKHLHKDQQYLSVEQEKDVLDTWFSSALIPFTYFDWPNQTERFKNCYPLKLMETGFDILKFWVHKMLIAGYYLTNQLPFEKIFLHGMIVDANGKKMSKSLGNVIDPLDFINGCTLNKLQSKLKQSYKDGYLTKEQLQTAIKGQKELFPKGLPMNSADGLRLCLYFHDARYEIIKMEFSLIYYHRNLINKIWQSFNFLLFIKQKMEDEQKIDLSLAPKFNEIDKRHFEEIDKWILACLNRFVQNSRIDYENHNLHNVYKHFIQFFLKSYCDVYIELIKPSIYDEDKQRIKLIRFSILKYCLSTLFSTIHPLIPFITEELYQKLKYLECELYKEKDYEYKSIYLSSYPDDKLLKQFRNDDLEDNMNSLMQCAIRMRQVNLITQTSKLDKNKLNFKIQSTDDILLDFLDSFDKQFKLLARSSNIKIDFNLPFLLNDGESEEFVVDKSLILKVNDSTQIVVDTSKFDLTEIFKKFVMKSYEKKTNETVVE